MTSKQSSDSSPERIERPYEWIDTPEHLGRLVEHISREDIVSIDTESDSFHHYRERVCLIQISTVSLDAIIDPLVLNDLSIMRPLFEDPAREWIMNGADYDIVCLKRDFGVHFGSIFDTVIAAQFLGYPATGLAAMLDRHFSVKVSKTFQRDEWFRRPLTKAQISYALNDTRYLIRLREILKKELEAAGRLSWAQEEFDSLCHKEWTREPFSPEDFWKIRKVHDLTPRQQLVLRELAVLRDRRAEEANRPPFKVISDSVLLAISKEKPTTSAALRRVRGMSPLMVRRFGDEVLEAVQRGLAASEGTLVQPPRGQRRRHDPGTSKRLDVLREWRGKKADQLSLDPGVLSPLACLRAVARANPSTMEEVLAIGDLSRWRAEAFGQEWIELLAKV